MAVVLQKKLYGIVKAIDEWLNDATKSPVLAEYAFVSQIDPWQDAVGTPHMTYMWVDGEIRNDELITARLDIMVLDSSESQEGPMHHLTNFLEDLVNAIFNIDLASLDARDNQNKPVVVRELRPTGFVLEPSFLEKRRAHTGFLRCVVHFVR